MLAGELRRVGDDGNAPDDRQRRDQPSRAAEGPSDRGRAGAADRHGRDGDRAAAVAVGQRAAQPGAQRAAADVPEGRELGPRARVGQSRIARNSLPGTPPARPTWRRAPTYVPGSRSWPAASGTVAPGQSATRPGERRARRASWQARFFFFFFAAKIDGKPGGQRAAGRRHVDGARRSGPARQREQMRAGRTQGQRSTSSPISRPRSPRAQVAARRRPTG